MLGELGFSQLSEMGQNSQWRQIDDDHNPSLEPRQPSWHHRQMQGFGSQETNKK